MKALEMYFSQIEKTNKKIGIPKNWSDYIKKFKKANRELYDALIRLTPYQVRMIDNEYLRNWIKNLRN